jgi:glycosyltransferase involved in cell wall biosynthesis
MDGSEHSVRQLGPVLLITPLWTRDGGVGTHVMMSAGALAARGHELHVLAARLDSDLRVPGVTLHEGARLLERDAPAELRLGSAPAAGAGVVHLHQLHDPGLVAALRTAAPVLISEHGYGACTSGVHHFGPGEQCTRGHGPGCIPNLLFRGCAHTRDPRWLPAAYGAATRASQALRGADVAISYSRTIDANLAANGVDSRKIVPLFPTVQPLRGTPGGERRRVLFAGRIVPAKGVDVLLHAARTVDAEFVICGEGWALDSMRRLAHRLGVEQRVRFERWLSPEDLARELAEASLLAMPSVWPEPFGLVGIEALASGRPVVASATGGILDWLEDGVNGLAFAPGDAEELARALAALLDDAPRRASMGAAGERLVAERFTVEAHTLALEDAYRLARRRWSSRAAGQPDASGSGSPPMAPAGAA